ncbi:TRAP transporter small permease [Haloplanus halobius]|uniref:TRAP transporter small permease n=1 Tax=Haloplanus halobius TaxID=2934938 RepID=UPI00200E2B8E|nr:TRAP transporter small permease [Haloplanus sp. XH21]
MSVRQDGLLDTVPLYVTTGMFLLTIVLATVQVLVRQLPIQIEFLFWTEPLARYLLIVMTYLGTAIAVRNDENVKIDLLQRWLQGVNPTLYHLLRILVSAFVLYFVYALFRGALLGAQGAWSSGTNLPHLSYGMIHAMIAVSTILMGIYTLFDLSTSVPALVARLRGQDGSTTVADMTADEPDAEMDANEASTRAKEMMGLSGDSESADGTDSEDQSSRDQR